jgi:uncharacterized membrane protein YidH (DUF202 family)
LVEEVPKFSKFIHGCATLLENKVSLLPFWLPQMDKDIRKPAIPGNPLVKTAERVSAVSRIETAPITQEQSIVEVDETDENTPLMGSSKTTHKGKGKQKEKAVKPLYGANSQIPSKMNDKRIIIPVRVEPKVFFANERTFLSWLHFCIVLGGLALGLLNFGDQVGQIAGLVFTAVAMLFMIYALFLYQWRAEKIRTRGIHLLTKILVLMMIE